jgi:hypothetical protein
LGFEFVHDVDDLVAGEGHRENLEVDGLGVRAVLAGWVGRVGGCSVGGLSRGGDREYKECCGC